MKKIYTLLFFMINCLYGFGQDLTFYGMNPDAYSSSIHPSVLPEKKFYLSFPFLSSLNVQYSNNCFTYHDLLKKRSDDSIDLNLDYVINRMKGNNYVGFELSENLIAFGMYIKDGYFDFSINERMFFGFAFPSDFINLIDKGNGPYIGKTLKLSNLIFEATHYREYSFGYSRQLNSKLAAGIHLKYLYGMDNFSSTNKDLNFTTAQDDYALQLSTNVIVNTSSYANSENGYDDMLISKYLFGLKNKGIGADLGATYKCNNKFTLSGSITDLGFIKWKENVKNFQTSAGSYSFNGIELKNFVNDTTGNIQSVLDSLSGTYKSKETKVAYTSYLHSAIYLSADYKFRERTSGTAIVRLQFFNGVIRPAISLCGLQKVGKALDINLSYSYVNRSFNNIGLGINLHAGSFRFYVVTDNVPGLLYPLDFHTCGVRGGFSFSWGSREKKPIVVAP